MKKLIVQLYRVKYALLLISGSLTAVSTLFWLFHNLSIRSVISTLVETMLLIAAGHFGIIGFNRLKADFLGVNSENRDTATVLITLVGLSSVVTLSALSIVFYYNDNLFLLSWGLGALTVGGITRLFTWEKGANKRLPRKKN